MAVSPVNSVTVQNQHGDIHFLQLFFQQNTSSGRLLASPVAELDHRVRMQDIRQLSYHFRFVGVGTVVQIADDLFRQCMERLCLVHLFHGINDDIAGNDLILPV